MSAVIVLDGSDLTLFGTVLQTALSAAATTAQPFLLQRIRATGSRPGLRPEQTTLVRAAQLLCAAKLGGAFDGSPELRFEPGPVQGGSFRFELPDGMPVATVLECLTPILACGQEAGEVELVGPTHVQSAATPEFLERLWLPVLGRGGLDAELALERASFSPGARGQLRLRTVAWQREGPLTELESRGAFSGLRLISSVGRLGRTLAERQAEGFRSWLWEQRRLEVACEVRELPSASPGACLLAEACFEGGSAGFGLLAEKATPPEGLGERLARRVLRFVEEHTAVLDPLSAERVVVPLALSRRGARLSTSEVTGRLEATCATLRAFGLRAETWGRLGGPGGCEVPAC